ncbi:AMP-binding protein, partial [Nocardioides kribbensis]|uniref:AMP-binding protein n=1 Tax=Nocardioides kribbensis TaxID=305517 RepID=UPI0031D3EDD7
METAPPKDWTALGDWIENALSAQPADTVWATAQSDITWEHLRHKVTELNELLGVRGIGPGTTVAVQMVPSYSYLWTVLALWLRGAQVILMDPRLTRLEVNRLVNLCEPQYLITSGASGAVRV